MKVLVIVPFPMTEEDLSGRRQQLEAIRIGDEVEFQFKPVRLAPANYTSHHDLALADFSILEAGIDAQADGFDAVCIDTMSDSGLSALRSVLSIPVIGPGRHAMLTALMLGRRFSILIMWDRWRPLYVKTLDELGLTWQCASVRSIGVQPNPHSLLAGKESLVFPKLLEAANRCIDEDGAEAIILGSTTMHQAHGYLAERLTVPVINPGPLTYGLAALALRLKLSHSRRAYPFPAATDRQLIEAFGSAGDA